MNWICRMLAMGSVLVTCQAMAHGGEDHGAAPEAIVSSVKLDAAQLLVRESSTDAVELVVKYPSLLAGEASRWTLFLANPMSNRPIDAAKVELSSSQIPDLKTVFSPVLGRPGIYEASVEVSQAGSFDAIFSVSGVGVNDLLIVNAVEVKAATILQHTTSQKWKVWVGLAGLCIIGISVWGIKRRPSRISMSIFILGVSMLNPIGVFAHGGEDHGDEETVHSAPSHQYGSNQVLLAKESQFLLGLTTSVADRELVKNAVSAFGKVTHRASGQQDILAPVAGRLRMATSKIIPIAGQMIKKGEVLGEIETIGTLPLRAPFDGVIAFSDFHPGQWVEPGTVLFRVTDPSVVWVESRLFEKDIALVAAGAKASVSVESLPQRSFEGTILAISQTVDETSRSIPITIEVQNPDGLLKVGQWAKVFLETTTSVQAIAVPKRAILMKEGVPVVFVKHSAEVFEGRGVQVANDYLDTVYLTSGVNAGEKIVVEGSYQLLPLLKTVVPQTSPVSEGK